MTVKPSLLLASNSPRRRELIALGGWQFSIAFTGVDEEILPEESPAEYALRLAEAKARASAQHAQDEHVIVAADTAVVDGEDILGKPGDVAESVAMLKRLRGHAHKVYTGIAVFRPRDDRMLRDLCVTEVPMRSYSDEEIDQYVQTGDPLDKAGAYAIQHPGFQPVENLRGCYASVMGLPICHLARTLRQMDIPSAANLPTNCQNWLHYHCPVSSAILRGEQIG